MPLGASLQQKQEEEVKQVKRCFFSYHWSRSQTAARRGSCGIWSGDFEHFKFLQRIQSSSSPYIFTWFNIVRWAYSNAYLRYQANQNKSTQVRTTDDYMTFDPDQEPPLCCWFLISFISSLKKHAGPGHNIKYSYSYIKIHHKTTWTLHI